MPTPLPAVSYAADPNDEHVLDFCQSLVSSGCVVALVPAPPPGAAENQCTILVDAAVGHGGGRRVEGWAIWERPGVLIEAEFHAVWKDPNGTVVDLAPLGLTPSATRTFLADPALAYCGKQINSRRRALSSLPAIADLLEALDGQFEIQNRGDRALDYGEIKLSGSEANEFRGLMAAQLDAERRIANRYVVRSAPCPCRSGLTYGKCHGHG